MKILVTGSNGQLGRCLQDRLIEYPFEVLALDHEDLDISVSSEVIRFCKAHDPDLIINAAAYTAVDKAEREPEQAAAVNAGGPKNLAEVCRMLDIPLIHISTDYVFDGAAIQPYKPNDEPSPESVYGETKLEGEKAVISAVQKHIIIRTAWVFSEYGHNFLKTMLRLGQERDSLSVVADQYGCPTYAGDLAGAILKIASQLSEDEKWPHYGVYHFCGEEATSWHGFARTVFKEAFSLGILSKIPKLKAISTDEYPTAAVRPKYSVLNCNDFPTRIENRNWQKSLRLVIQKIGNRI